MTAILLDEYSRLERESSNLLLEGDFLRVRGQPFDAALCSFRAGELRKQMAQSKVRDNQFADAAEDWLSAAQCFIDAGTAPPVNETVAEVQRFLVQGRLPQEREDLLRELTARRQAGEQMERRRQDLLREIQRQGYRLDVPDPTFLALLEGQIPLLAGEALLHHAISRQAEQLNQPEKAVRHLSWAAAFDPFNPTRTALLGYQYLARGAADQAVVLGEKFLNKGAIRTGPVRIMLAIALTVAAQEGLSEHQRAIEVLHPLLQATKESPVHQAAGLILLILLLRERGEEDAARQFLTELEHLLCSTQAPEAQALLTDVQLALAPSANGNGNSLGGPGLAVLAETRRRLYSIAKELSLVTAVQEPGLVAVS